MIQIMGKTLTKIVLGAYIIGSALSFKCATTLPQTTPKTKIKQEQRYEDKTEEQTISDNDWMTAAGGAIATMGSDPQSQAIGTFMYLLGISGNKKEVAEKGKTQVVVNNNYNSGNPKENAENNGFPYFFTFTETFDLNGNKKIGPDELINLNTREKINLKKESLHVAFLDIDYKGWVLFRAYNSKGKLIGETKAYNSLRADENGGAKGLEYSIGVIKDNHKNSFLDKVEINAIENDGGIYVITANTVNGKKYGQIINLEIE